MEIDAGDLSGWAQMFVALLALWYTVNESKRSRKERHIERLAAAGQRRAEREADDYDRKLRARPNLSAMKELNEIERRLQYILRNDGLGPATIRELRVKYRNENIDRLDISRIMTEFDITECKTNGFMEGLNNTILPAGEKLILVDITFVQAEADFRVRDVIDVIDFGASYSSIYGEEFEVETF